MHVRACSHTHTHTHTHTRTHTHIHTHIHTHMHAHTNLCTVPCTRFVGPSIAPVAPVALQELARMLLEVGRCPVCVCVC